MKTAFAETLSKLRREKGLSQRRAAAHLGISQALLSHYENGAREPKLEFVIKVCDYYNVPADYILGRSEERCSESVKLMNNVGEIVNSLELLRADENVLRMKLKHLGIKD